jgi:hypothetical protein
MGTGVSQDASAYNVTRTDGEVSQEAVCAWRGRREQRVEGVTCRQQYVTTSSENIRVQHIL